MLQDLPANVQQTYMTEEHETPTLRRPKVSIAQTITGFQRFPLNNFKYFLTLFSKFFSSFPHGTCSLSVSHQYLALDGIYHPLWAAIPSNSTRREQVVNNGFQGMYGIITLHDAKFLVDLALDHQWHYFYRLQFGFQRKQIFNLSSSRFTRRY